MKWLTLLVIASVSPLVACEDPEEPIEVSLILYNSQGLGFPSVIGLSTVRISVKRPQLTNKTVSVQEFPLENQGAQLSGLDYGEGYQIIVEGLDVNGYTVVDGGTLLFDVDRDVGHIFSVFLSPKDTFSQVTAIFQGNEVYPSFFWEGPRAGHRLVSLSDGRILMIGGAVITSPGMGIEGTEIALVRDTLEVYNPQTGYFDVLPNTLSNPRAFHTATPLKDGRILVAGGITQIEDYQGGLTLQTLRTAEIIDPQGGNSVTIDLTDPMSVERANHTASLRPDGTVLIVGGSQRFGTSEVYLGSLELFWPEGQFFQALDNLALDTARSDHTAVSMTVNQTVLICGGRNSEGVLDSCLIVAKRPSGENVKVTGFTMSEPRYGHSALRTNPGEGTRVLIMGGYTALGNSTPTNSFEVFDASGTTPDFPDEMKGLLQQGRAFFTALELSDDDVVVFGGLGTGGGPLDIAERLDYNPATNVYMDSAITSRMVRARYWFDAITMRNGHILIAGGVTSGGSTLNEAEIFNPSLSE